MIKTLIAITTILGSNITIDKPMNALSYPTGYDYAYTYNGGVGTYEWSVVGSYSQYAVHTRTGSTSTTYDYNWSITGVGIPFKMYHYHNDSTLGGWTPYSFGYVPTTEYIGSTGYTDADKVDLIFENDTPNSYLWSIDTSTSASLLWDLDSWFFNDGVQGSQLQNITYTDNPAYMKEFVIAPYTKTQVSNLATSSKVVLSAYYIRTLSEDILADNVFDGIYTDGYSDGYEDGLEQGYTNANTMNQASNGLLDIFTSVFTGVGAIFSIQILPSITIGMVIFAPIIFILLMFILKLLRGGS